MPPVNDELAANVPASFNRTVPPALMVIFPERFLPEAIETGVRLLTEKSVTMELLSMDKPELPAEVFTLARLIPERFNLPFAPLRLRELVF